MEKQSLALGLYALVDDAVRPDLPVLEKVRLAKAARVPTLQLRLKKTPTPDALALVRQAVRLCAGSSTCVVVNDRVDLALLAGAHGAHVGDDDVPPAVAREVLGPYALLGVTVRDADRALEAARSGASYVGLGPLFSTSTKTVAHELLGLEGLSRVVRSCALPVAAIAGIGLDNIEEVARMGARAAAVCSDLWLDDRPLERAEGLMRAFARGRGLVDRRA